MIFPASTIVALTVATLGILSPVRARTYVPFGYTPADLNCDGNAMCSSSGPVCHQKYGKTCLAELRDLVADIPDNTTYTEGEHVACASTAGHLGICIFGENFINRTDVITAKDAKDLVGSLMGISCNVCGNYNMPNKVIKVQYTSKA